MSVNPLRWHDARGYGERRQLGTPLRHRRPPLEKACLLHTHAHPCSVCHAFDPNIYIQGIRAGEVHTGDALFAAPIKRLILTTPAVTPIRENNIISETITGRAITSRPPE
jgi:hypothetical protein